MNKPICKCLTEERRAYIEAAINFADGFSDGAFIAYLEECGISLSELEVLSEDHECGSAEDSLEG